MDILEPKLPSTTDRNLGRAIRAFTGHSEPAALGLWVRHLPSAEV
jgi:hypothetical protein